MGAGALALLALAHAPHAPLCLCLVPLRRQPERGLDRDLHGAGILTERAPVVFKQGKIDDLCCLLPSDCRPLQTASPKGERGATWDGELPPDPPSYAGPRPSGR
jgi:hypothetical protein